MNRAARGGLLFAAVFACNGQFRFEDTDAAAPPRCVQDTDCRLSTLHCDAVSGQCVACTIDAQCTHSDQPRCDTGEHRCVGCTGDGDCFGRVCEPTTRRCVLTCSATLGCPPGVPWCDTSRDICVRCRNDGDCVGSEDGPTCDVEAAHCVTCTADSQCPAESPRCDRTHGRCVQCTSSVDCSSPEACDPDALVCI